MSFVPYPKIAEAVSDWRLSEADMRRLDRARWAVTEKLHGANFSLITDGQRLRSAKRKAPLGPGDDFFNFREVMAAQREACLSLFHALRQDHPELQAVQVYGELFGGRYPHPDVPAVEGVHPIQTGVWYCPDVRFCAFDLALETPSGRRLLDLPELQARCAEAGLLAVQTLAEGRLEEALAWPLPFESRVPARLGLAPLPQPNPAEGVVVRPTQELLVAGPKGPLRPLVKRKIEAFAEERAFHLGRPWSTPAAEALGPLEQAALSLLTPARADAAISKQGEGFLRDPKAEEALLIELTEDAWATLQAQEGARLDQIGEEDRALLRAVLADEARALLHYARRQRQA